MIEINQYVFSNPDVYVFVSKTVSEILLCNISLSNGEDFKRCAYTAWQQKNYRWPDQIFLGCWDDLLEQKNECGSWSCALLGQVADRFFDKDNRRLAIDRALFDPWQSWTSNQSALPVVAYKVAGQLRPAVVAQPFELLAVLRERMRNNCLPCAFHPLVEDYITQQGLHESHMHLNGTTSIENLWCHALCRPEATVEHLEEAMFSERVRLLYTVNAVFKQPSDIYQLLIVARHVRETLLVWLEAGPDDELKCSKQVLCKVLKGPVGNHLASFPLEKSLFTDMAEQPHLAELHWQVRLLARLRVAPDPLVDACYLLYVLSMNNFQRFAVQRNDQMGFDWFQKFADDGVREHIELAYDARFRQLHGNRAGGVVTLECRIAPKKTNVKNIELLTKVFKGFLFYHHGAEQYPLRSASDLNELASQVHAIKKPALRLVAHFIKRPWQPCGGEPYYKTLRDSLFAQANLLIELLANTPALKNILTGIDAAANELETPPDVFAGLYRFCRYYELRNFTYHVGEDFKHLVSGIRAVHDAVTLLALTNGDRLGHATAIGILPKQWLDNMPKFIYLEQGQWLDDLLFVRQVALSDNTTVINLESVEREIRRLISVLFGSLSHSRITVDTLQGAFTHRELLPEALDDYLKGRHLSYTGWMWQEIELVKKAKERVGEDALQCLYLRWFNGPVLDESAKKTKVSVTEFDADTLLLLQQYVQREVEAACVVIETLPTSNVRISHYQSVHQHHIFRWLKMPGREEVEDANLIVTLGSDDPGIFATSIKNEFYHIFCALINHFGCSAEEALSYAARINENGRIYRFDNEI